MLLRVHRVARPHKASDAQEVVAGGVEVARHEACAVTSGRNSAHTAIDAALVEDLAEAIREVDFASIGVELYGGESGTDEKVGWGLTE